MFLLNSRLIYNNIIHKRWFYHKSIIIYVDYRIKRHTPLLVFKLPSCLLGLPLAWIAPGNILNAFA